MCIVKEIKRIKFSNKSHLPRSLCESRKKEIIRSGLCYGKKMKPQAKLVKVICNQRLPIGTASNKNILFYICKSKS